MSSAVKTVVSRSSGWCANDFAHPARISPGDRVRVTVHFPGDAYAPDTADRGFARVRECSWCLERDEYEAAQRSPAPAVAPA